MIQQWKVTWRRGIAYSKSSDEVVYVRIIFRSIAKMSVILIFYSISFCHTYTHVYVIYIITYFELHYFLIVFISSKEFSCWNLHDIVTMVHTVYCQWVTKFCMQRCSSSRILRLKIEIDFVTSWWCHHSLHFSIHVSK